MDVLKWLFQNKKLFPFPAEQDQIMGEQSEKVERALERLRQTLDAGQTEQLRSYLEQLEQLQAIERQLDCLRSVVAGLGTFQSLKEIEELTGVKKSTLYRAIHNP